MTKRFAQDVAIKGQNVQEEPTLMQESAGSQMRLLRLIVKHVLKKSSDEAVNADRVGDS